MAQYIVGVDLGGTRMRAGVVSCDEPDRVLWSASAPTERDDPEKGILALASLVREVVRTLPQCDGGITPSPAQLVAVGIGAPGPYDDAKQEFAAFANLPAWSGFPMGARLSSQLGVPVAQGNDANVAAIGEFRAGAGKGMTDVIFVTLGTGVGGTVIAGGKIHAGHSGTAGEFGHVQADPDGAPCGCGKKGCVETVASGTGIARMYGAPAPQAFEAAAKGEERAIGVIRRAGEALAVGLASAVVAIDPEAVIVGGGLASGNPAAVKILLEFAEDEVWRRTRLPGRGPVPFVKGILGDNAGILGAAYLARELR